MKVVWRRKNLEQHLLQLQKIYKRYLLTTSGVYSCLAFFSLGMIGVFPAVSQIRENVIPAQEVASDTKKSAQNVLEERCYWQEDVAQFLTFQEKKKNVSQTEIPCEVRSADVPIVSMKKKDDVPGNSELGATIRELTVGYPIAVMAESIATYDREVAALIVGIAKKESDWGKHVPTDTSGADCFNYWGYKGAGTRGVEMGHGCFGSPEEAVAAVGNRLQELVAIRETSSPADMIIWKCGSSCKGHSDESVKKWISDVALYYNQIMTRPVSYIQK
ncbi:MAG: hypothetical protein WCG73_03485 [Candidatus Moraniibacteriota bacterium]